MPHMTTTRRTFASPLLALAIGLLMLITAAMLGASPAEARPLSLAPSAAATPAGLPRLPTASVVRIGFFANLTHAPALIAQDQRLFEALLGRAGTSVEYVLFNAGPAAVEAMKGGAIDMAFVGPSPSISGFASTNGDLLRIVAGVTSGGAQLVVNDRIRSVANLEGARLTTPQLGNTQDVALRSWLRDKGFSTSVSGGGDVEIFPTPNATTLQLFRRGDIDGAWVPEPWASRLVQEFGGRVLVDERSLWPNGEFVTTNLVASQDFLSAYPGTVRSVIQATTAAVTFIDANPSRSQTIARDVVIKWTGKPLPDAAVRRAWGTMAFTYDPLASTLARNAEDAVSVGLLRLPAGGLSGIYDLRLLNSLLRSAGRPTVSAGGLGLQ